MNAERKAEEAEVLKTTPPWKGKMEWKDKDHFVFHDWLHGSPLEYTFERKR